MADSGTSWVVKGLWALNALLGVIAVDVGNVGQRAEIVLVGVIVLSVSLLALFGVYVISKRHGFWLIVTVCSVILIGYGIVFPAVPPVGIPAGR